MRENKPSKVRGEKRIEDDNFLSYFYEKKPHKAYEYRQRND